MTENVAAQNFQLSLGIHNLAQCLQNFWLISGVAEFRRKVENSVNLRLTV